MACRGACSAALRRRSRQRGCARASRRPSRRSRPGKTRAWSAEGAPRRGTPGQTRSSSRQARRSSSETLHAARATSPVESGRRGLALRDAHSCRRACSARRRASHRCRIAAVTFGAVVGARSRADCPRRIPATARGLVVRTPRFARRARRNPDRARRAVRNARELLTPHPGSLLRHAGSPPLLQERPRGLQGHALAHVWHTITAKIPHGHPFHGAPPHIRSGAFHPIRWRAYP